MQWRINHEYAKVHTWRKSILIFWLSLLFRWCAEWQPCRSHCSKRMRQVSIQCSTSASTNATSECELSSVCVRVFEIVGTWSRSCTGPWLVGTALCFVGQNSRGNGSLSQEFPFTSFPVTLPVSPLFSQFPYWLCHKLCEIRDISKLNNWNLHI